MKKFLNFFSKFAFSICVILYLLIAPSVILKKVLNEQDGLFSQESIFYYGVIDMWHIESFEGGSASRTSFLQKRAQEFEKNNKGAFISIVSMSLEEAKINLQNGKKPKIISFSLGLGDYLKTELLEYKGKKIGLEKLLLAGKFNNKQLAVPYILGGYCGFNMQNSIILSGLKDNSLTSLSLAINKETNSSFIMEKSSFNLDSYNAYASFIKGKSGGFFGSQRDFYRLNNRINNNSLKEGEFTFSSFTDLLQFVGICKGTNEDEIKIATSFIEYLTSKESQKALLSYGMFSVLEEVIYDKSSNMFAFESFLKNNLKTVNVFLAQSEISKIKELSNKYLKNESDSLKRAKNYII